MSTLPRKNGDSGQIGRVLLLALAASVTACQGLHAQAGPQQRNASITHRDVQLRKSYPSFAPSTLFKFRLQPGALIAVVPRGSRVTVYCSKTVSDQEWLQVRYRGRVGWVYAGQKGGERYVQLDPGTKEQACDTEASLRGLESFIGATIGALVLPRPLGAQEASPASPPPAWANPGVMLLCALVQLVLFLGSVVVIRKWVFPQSDVLTYLSSFSVLLVLGLINSDALVQLVKVLRPTV